MNNFKIIDLTSENITEYGLCGYKNVKKHVELQRKLEWFKSYTAKGLKIKAVIADDGSYQGMIEYIPGKYAHRPVDADGYMFIQCVFVGFRKEFKGKGMGTQMIQECINDAEKQKMKGVSVVTRKGSFMAKKDIFEKLDFKVVDSAKPDFDLLVLRFDKNAEDPKFKNNTEMLSKYKEGLVILRSCQCPYTEKNVNAIVETAKNDFDLEVKLIDLEDHEEVQHVPNAFGVFTIVYKGEVISYHPISKTRFKNIMKGLLDSD